MGIEIGAGFGRGLSVRNHRSHGTLPLLSNIAGDSRRQFHGEEILFRIVVKPTSR
jgi:hypothetical protein